jgi:hypothetical protein
MHFITLPVFPIDTNKHLTFVITVCDKYPDTTDNRKYIQYVEGHGNISMSCPPGTVFNNETCNCDIHDTRPKTGKLDGTTLFICLPVFLSLHENHFGYKSLMFVICTQAIISKYAPCFHVSTNTKIKLI